MCITPITLVKNYRDMDKRGTNACNIVPCGKCIICLKRRSASWAFRLRQEQKRSISSSFLTFTYEKTPLSYNGNATLEKKDYQDFTKRLRQKLKRDKSIYKSHPIKYYTCGEYGQDERFTERPHYHSIMFNLPNKYFEKKIIEEIWNKGIVDILPCTPASIRYVTNYITKGSWQPKNELDDRNPEFSLMSKKMGANHLTKEMIHYYKKNMISAATLEGGDLTSLPRYFREKVFNKEERKILAIEATENRDKIFEEQFKNSFKQELTWKKNQIRKQEKDILHTRKSL